ncbi:YkvA family protein [Massilia sp. TSP1-1-2]|uniref:YkvA family protein n=1 Tax=Massilia sp. TSP1-1-2 TaxID=2804649 RepID=UPI003CF64F70
MVDFKKKDASRPEADTRSRRMPWSLGSRSYGKSTTKAADYIQSKEKLSRLIDQASLKATGRQGKLKGVWSSLLAFFRLVRAYGNGSYRQVAPRSLLMIVASLVYFVSPIDLIPDFIFGIGLIDDATVLAWTIKACASDLAAFINWEKSRAARKPRS